MCNLFPLLRNFVCIWRVLHAVDFVFPFVICRSGVDTTRRFAFHLAHAYHVRPRLLITTISLSLDARLLGSKPFHLNCSLVCDITILKFWVLSHLPPQLIGPMSTICHDPEEFCNGCNTRSSARRFSIRSGASCLFSPSIISFVPFPAFPGVTNVPISPCQRVFIVHVMPAQFPSDLR